MSLSLEPTRTCSVRDTEAKAPGQQVQLTDQPAPWPRVRSACLGQSTHEAEVGPEEGVFALVNFGVRRLSARRGGGMLCTS